MRHSCFLVLSSQSPNIYLKLKYAEKVKFASLVARVHIFHIWLGLCGQIGTKSNSLGPALAHINQNLGWLYKFKNVTLSLYHVTMMDFIVPIFVNYS
jgi:hypothetical protein